MINGQVRLLPRCPLSYGWRGPRTVLSHADPVNMYGNITYGEIYGRESGSPLVGKYGSPYTPIGGWLYVWGYGMTELFTTYSRPSAFP